jgi:hypothetical protein
MATDTGVRVRGFQVWYEISQVSGPFCYLKTAEKVSCPVAYNTLGEDFAGRELRTWRDSDGTAHALVSGGPWAYEPLDRIKKLSPAEAEAVIAAKDRITAERFPEQPATPSPVKVEVPALDEIASACEAERTPLRLRQASSQRRTCVECGSPVYGEFCTHCFES